MPEEENRIPGDRIDDRSTDYEGGTHGYALEPWLLILIGVVSIGLSGAAGYFLRGSELAKADVQHIGELQAVKASAEAHAADLTFQSAMQKRLGDIQTEVAKDCVAKGLAPQFLNGGNVTCPPK